MKKKFGVVCVFPRVRAFLSHLEVKSCEPPLILNRVLNVRKQLNEFLQQVSVAM